MKIILKSFLILCLFIGNSPPSAKGDDSDDVFNASFNPKSCFKDENEYARLLKRRQLAYDLIGKFVNIAGAKKWLSYQYGINYTDLYSFSKGFGKSWYQFGLNSSSGYESIFKADALEADLKANSSARTNVSVTLFNFPITILDANLGAGNYMDLFDPKTGFASTSDTFKKWQPKIEANVKIYGITVFTKKLPEAKDAAKETSANEVLKKLQENFEKSAASFKDDLREFGDKLTATSTEIGSAKKENQPEKPTSSMEQKTKLSKSFFNFRRSAKDILQTSLIIPVVPPLNVEIDFGVYFSSSVDFQIGIAGGGFSINVTKNMMATAPGTSLLDQAKNSLISNRTSSLIGNVMSGNFMVGDLAQLTQTEEGLETINQLMDAAETVKTEYGGRSLNKEIKASVKILPAISAGGFATASVVLDLAVASASAGIEGNLNLIQSRLGGGLDFSSVSDYVDLTATGFINLMSGVINLFAKLDVDALVYKNSWEWRWELFNFPGITKEFNLPIARIAYRGGNASDSFTAVRPILCIDQSFKPVAKYAYSGSSVNECDLATRFVPDTKLNDLNTTVASLLSDHGIAPADPSDPCVIVLNGRLVVNTSKNTQDCYGALDNSTSDTSSTARSQRTSYNLKATDNLVQTANSLYPEKFISNLYDTSGRPALVFESFVDGKPAGKPAFYSGDRVSKYFYVWNNYFTDMEAAAKAAGNKPNNQGLYQDSNSNDYIPRDEPTIKLASLTTPEITNNPIPVEQIGWLNDKDILSASNEVKTGFCSLIKGPLANDKNDPNQKCSYYVNVMGIPFPDGISCVSNTGTLLSFQSGQPVEKSAASYDCSSSAISYNSEQVAACLLRKAFQYNYCFPPEKANYIVRLYNYLDNVSEDELFFHLDRRLKNTASSEKGKFVTPATIPPYELNTCKISVSRDKFDSYSYQYVIEGDPCYYKNDGCDVPCPSLNSEDSTHTGGKCISKGSCPFVGTKTQAKKQCIYTTFKERSTAPSYPYTTLETKTAYKGTCSASIQNQSGKNFGSISCTDTNGTNTASEGNTICDCSGNFSALITTFRSALKTGSCIIDMSTTPSPLKDIEQKPSTCELIAQSPPNTGSPVLVPFPTGSNTFANRAECKNMFSGAESNLCAKAKTVLPEGTSIAAISSRFKMSEIDEITTCRYETDGSTLTSTSGPSLTSKAEVKEGCDILAGDAPNNTLLLKSFSGMSTETTNTVKFSDDSRSLQNGSPTKSVSSNYKVDACADVLPKDRTQFCNTMDSPTLLKMRSLNFKMSEIQVYTRNNTLSSNGSTTAGSPVFRFSCDLSEPATVLTRNMEGNTLGACDLVATSTYGNKVLIDRKTTTASTTADSCFNSFQPYSMICESLVNNSEIKRENISKTNSFKNGVVVPLTMRFTSASGTKTAKEITPVCKFGPPEKTGNTCELQVTLTNGTKVNMNGTAQSGYSTKDLRSYSATSEQDCYLRFLAGATLPSSSKSGDNSANTNKSVTCFGLSSQIAGSNSSINALSKQTVQMHTRFNQGSKLTYIGSCSYDELGKPALNAIEIEKTTAPKLEEMNSICKEGTKPALFIVTNVSTINDQIVFSFKNTGGTTCKMPSFRFIDQTQGGGSNWVNGSMKTGTYDNLTQSGTLSYPYLNNLVGVNCAQKSGAQQGSITVRFDPTSENYRYQQPITVYCPNKATPTPTSTPTPTPPPSATPKPSVIPTPNYDRNGTRNY